MKNLKKSGSPKKTRKNRMHNPNGGGFRPSTQVHELKENKKSADIEDKIARGGKLTLQDLRDLIYE